ITSIAGETQGKLQLTSSSGTTWNVSSNIPSVHNLGFAIWSNESSIVPFAIRHDNKIGINTTSPTEALDVIGNIKATGSGDIEGDISVGGNADFKGTV
ncbi:hypothetical protein, partial [Xanthovirga aplysinae]|uniref:hypothetical protein n=1 Tax=Xanthovirga aplysinae TaxID=2529853 RepID=UPI001CA461C7